MTFEDSLKTPSTSGEKNLDTSEHQGEGVVDDLEQIEKQAHEPVDLLSAEKLMERRLQKREANVLREEIDEMYRDEDGEMVEEEEEEEEEGEESRLERGGLVGVQKRTSSREKLNKYLRWFRFEGRLAKKNYTRGISQEGLVSSVSSEETEYYHRSKRDAQMNALWKMDKQKRSKKLNDALDKVGHSRNEIARKEQEAAHERGQRGSEGNLAYQKILTELDDLKGALKSAETQALREMDTKTRNKTLQDFYEKGVGFSEAFHENIKKLREGGGLPDFKILKRESDGLLRTIKQEEQNVKNNISGAQERLKAVEAQYNKNRLMRKAVGGAYVKRNMKADGVRGNRDKHGVLKPSSQGAIQKTGSSARKRYSSNLSLLGEIRRRRKRKKLKKKR